MSYERHRGGGRRRNQHRDEDRREVIESPQERLRSAIIKLGEVDPVEELRQLEQHIRESPVALPNITEAFHIAVTEQPYKIPYYVAVLSALYTSEDTSLPPVGQQIVEDFWKGFQAYLDKLAWRETRACIHFFAHLAMAGLVSVESFVSLLQAFTAVLEELGVSNERGIHACLCAAEGLMIAGAVVKAHNPAIPAEIIAGIEAYVETTSSARWMAQPMLRLYSLTEKPESADEILDTAISALKALDETNFEEEYESFVRPYQSVTIPAATTPFVIPSVLVPPEVIELDSLATDSSQDTQVRKEQWPSFYVRLFDNQVTPNPHTPAGYMIRSALLSIIDIFEVNRKECARLLLEYPKWLHPGTFKPKPGAPSDVDPIPGKEWQLESTVIETALGALLLLPEGSHQTVYYISLITEICKLSPSTTGPAVGKSIRKLYQCLGDGLDIDIWRRFAEWFATHMSNFGFQWVWKEWIPDLVLSPEHPRRSFMRRALELEIRLAYFERIQNTLPEEMKGLDAGVPPTSPPGPASAIFEDTGRAHMNEYQSIVNLFRGRATFEDVISQIDVIRPALEGSVVNVDSELRSLVIDALLHVGSRSFSHLLNAIERYLPLLRYVASGWISNTSSAGNLEARLDILTSAANFWKTNSQMVGIVFDKLMQYQIVDPTDVVEWVFTRHMDTSGTDHVRLSSFAWDLLNAALGKANGRVMISRKRLAVLRKEDDETRARAKAGDMEVDGDTAKPEEAVVVPENAALQTGLKAFNSLTKEQKSALARALDGFVSSLSTDANPHVRTVITEKGWHNRANWGDNEWNAWENWAWYKHFCRTLSPYLRVYATSLSTVSFAKFQGQEDEVSKLIQNTFAIATGDYPS